MLTRRRMLASAAVMGTSLAAMGVGVVRAAAPTVRTAVDFDVPRGACDCHVHVFDPARLGVFAAVLEGIDIVVVGDGDGRKVLFQAVIDQVADGQSPVGKS